MFYDIFLQKNLHMSEKSSTFAPAFEKHASLAQSVRASDC